MKKVLVVVSGCIADYIADEGVEVAIFDEDNWDAADPEERVTYAENLEGFEHLTPGWVKELIEEEKDGTD